MTITRIGVVGGGWRASFFARLARDLDEHFELVGMAARSADTRNRLAERYAVDVHASAEELVLRAAPDLVVVSVPASSIAGVTTDVVRAGAYVLMETPPAETVDGLRELWAAVGSSGRVQVAEQYLLLPSHASRREVVRRGLIGMPTSVQVSSTHNYHAVSIMRGILGAGFEPVTVRASRRSAPLLDPLNRGGWIAEPQVAYATNTIATVDFPEGLGLYDFTDNQWHNQLRHRRIVIRGSHGEIVDQSVIRMAGAQTIVRSNIERRQLGYDLDLDGYDTEQIAFEGAVVYRNPFLGHRLMDEEIAIASIMRAAGEWARDSAPAPYPLSEALQDQLVGLAIDEAAASGREIRTPIETWAPSRRGRAVA